MFVVFGVVLRAIHIEELEAIHQRRIFLLGRNILFASWKRLVKGSSTLVTVPLDLRSFVSTVKY
jgi:hypothetical protein